VSKSQLCRLFSMVRSSYYYGAQSKPISLKTVKLKALIRQIFNESSQSAGTRTIIGILWHQHSVRLTRYMASKLMRSMGLKSVQLRTHKYKHCDAEHKTHDNLLDRNFNPPAPNQVWTGDVTYIRVKGGWCYLAIVLDLYARRVVGFAVSDSPDSVLTTTALDMAYHTRLNPSDLLFHSDQGTHYTSKKFAESVSSCDGMIQSMSHRGNNYGHSPSPCTRAKQYFAYSRSWDNAPTERFFRSFKTEWMPKGGYEDIFEAKRAICNYIWGYYQTVRPHTFNNYLTPVEKEKRYFNQNLLVVV